MAQDSHRHTPASPPAAYSHLHQWTAVAMLVASFPLIFLGGLTTSHGAGMAVPDWPNTYGYNMWLFPPSMWIGGIFYEHTHRLLGTLVGLLSIFHAFACYSPARNPVARSRFGWVAIISPLVTVGLFLIPAVRAPTGLPHHLPSLTGSMFAVSLIGWVCRKREPRMWVRRMSVGILLCIIIQGLLGGFRVTEVNIHLAVIHGVFAQLVLCMLAFAAVATSRWWLNIDGQRIYSSFSRQIAHMSVVVFGLILAQLVVGAMMRHYQAGLAIPDLPLAYGQFLPPTDSEGLAAANAARVALNEPVLKPVSLFQIWLHFGHRMGAIVASLGMLALAWFSIKRGGRIVRIKGLGILLVALVVIQVTLGLLTVYFRKPADITTLHHTVGALCMMVAFLVGVYAYRAFAPSAATASGAASSPVTPSNTAVPNPAVMATPAPRT